MARTLDVYARVSHKADKRIISTEAQVTHCRARVVQVGAEVGKVFVDPGRSAWNPRVRRPDWEAMMTRLEAGESDGVVVFDLARFARRPADGERLIEAAERGLAVLDAGSEYDLTSASGRKNFRDNVNAAAYYSDMISESTRRGKAYKAAQGEVDARRSFGFEPDGVTVRQGEARVIRDHAARLLAGESQEALIADLNAVGVGVRGARWGYTTYRQIMTRPRNAGIIVHNGKAVPGVRLPGPQILDDDTHARLVALYAARRPGRQPSGRYTLTGIATCACGATLSGRPVSGSTRTQYWCKACHHTFVDARRLDDHVGDWAVRVLSDPQHADALAQADRELEAARERLLDERATIEVTLTEVAGRLGRQEMSLARHDAVAVPLDARLATIAAELAGLVADEPAPLPGRTIPARDAARLGWLEQWTDGTPAERRAMVLRALAGRTLRIGPGKAAKFDPARVSVA